MEDDDFKVIPSTHR